MRAKAVADGQQVEIPVLRDDRTVGTRMGGTTGKGTRGKREAGPAGKTAGGKARPRDDRNIVGKCEGHASRKAAIVHHVPVPQTDTGG